MFNTMGNVVTLFFQWLIIMLIPKITNFVEAGVFTVAISACSILNQVAQYSMREFQISDQNAHFTDRDFTVFRQITVAVSFALIIPISLLFSYDLNQVLVILAYMTYRNLIHYAYLYSASLQIKDHLDRVGLDMAVEGILSFSSFMAVYLATSNLILATAVMAVIGGGYFIFSQRLAYGKWVGFSSMAGRTDKAKLKSLALIGLPLFASVLIPTLITAMPKLLLQNIQGDELAGIFGTLSTPTIIIPTLAISVCAPFIVDFSNMSRNNEINKIRSTYMKLFGIILGGGILLTLLSIVLQEFVFVLVYGEEIRPYADLFARLVFGITLYSIGTVGSTVLLTMNRGQSAAISAIIALLIGIVLCFVLIDSSGIDGAANALTISYTLFGILVSICVLLQRPRNLNIAPSIQEP